MVNENIYSFGEQQQLIFEDEDEILDPLYLSEKANLILAKETVINLAYYFHINKNSTLDSYKRIKDLFPKAAHVMEKEGYTLAKAAMLELENKLIKVYKDVNQLNARCIILVYKLLAYEKNHKRGRSKGFMTLSELDEKDIWKLKEFIKRTFNFFEENPGGSLKVNLTNKEHVTDQSMFIDYLCGSTLFEIKLVEEDQNYIHYQELFIKKEKYNTRSGNLYHVNTVCIFDPCANTKYEQKDAPGDIGFFTDMTAMIITGGAVIFFLAWLLNIKK